MTERFFDAIEWQRPWLLPFSTTAASLMQAAAWKSMLNSMAAQRGLVNHRGLPIRFVPQADLPRGRAYEAFISDTGGVPTRDNLHDFFNALVWLTFPQVKVRLNALQATEIARSSSSSASRGNVRDAATIFDESAALMVARDPAMIAALRAHDWNQVFVQRRHEFKRHCEVWLFGHALLEKLARPYKAITAHAWAVIADEEYFGLQMDDRRIWLDACVARQLAGDLTTAAFTPLPVLGIPGWWEGQDEAFYADTAVFRPGRRQQEHKKTDSHCCKSV